MHALTDRFVQLENTIHRQLVRHSVTLLRISLGLVFLGFGILKYFPGVSPAQNITETTTHLLFLGLVPSRAGVIAIATLECFIGICLLTGKGMRLAIWLLAMEFVGILSPIVLLPGRLFSGPHHAPTLEGQYVLKDIILVAAGLVIAATTFRGGRIIRDEPQRVPPRLDEGPATLDAARRLQVVLDGTPVDTDVHALCLEHGISEGAYYRWRDIVLQSATSALSTEPASERAASPTPG